MVLFRCGIALQVHSSHKYLLSLSYVPGTIAVLGIPANEGKSSYEANTLGDRKGNKHMYTVSSEECFT